MSKSIEFIPVNRPNLGEIERQAVIDCIDSGWISSEGPQVRRFEKALADCVGRKFGIAVASGSAALDVAVAALGIGKGDEVIMPAFTIISCAAAILRSGGVPVLVDSEVDSWNMNISEIEQKITKKTKAIMVVHIYGLAVNMREVRKIADKHGLLIIEDAAEMLGQECEGAPCGSFGDVSLFSFYANKHVTTGEGGMIVCDSPTLADKCRSFMNLCFQEKQRFVHEDLGWNYRMTSLQASLGLAQLSRLQEFVEKKRQMGGRYNKALSGLPGVKLPQERNNVSENIYWVYGLLIDDPRFTVREVTKKLGDLGVGTRPFFWPMHKQPVFKKLGLFVGEDYPVATYLGHNGFYVPSGLGLTEAEQVHVSGALWSIFDV
jgi:perosamine synthetase